MSKQEIEERLTEVENAIWNIEMKDRWNESDFSRMHELECERADLKRMLKEVSE